MARQGTQVATHQRRETTGSPVLTHRRFQVMARAVAPSVPYSRHRPVPVIVGTRTPSSPCARRRPFHVMERAAAPSTSCDAASTPRNQGSESARSAILPFSAALSGPQSSSASKWLYLRTIKLEAIVKTNNQPDVTAPDGSHRQTAQTNSGTRMLDTQ